MAKELAFVNTEQTDPRTCPVCNRVLDGVTSISMNPANRRPQLRLDAVTCCAYCGALLAVTTVGFRLATDADIDHLDPKLRTLLFVLSADVQARRGQR